MNTRFLAIPLATLIVSLSGCGTAHTLINASSRTTDVLHAKDAPPPGVDPAPFLDAAKQAIDLANKDPNKWRNAVMVSIEGHGLDQTGKLVPLLGGNWTFKFWANKVDDGRMDTTFSLVNVVKHVEGPLELVDAGETRQTDLVRALDPAKLSTPSQIVPFAIRLGLRVNRAGAGYNFYDVTYNGFYANPSAADANVCDVVSYYQQSTIDGLHIPADAGLLPPLPVVKPGTPSAPGVGKLSNQELAANQARRKSRQHIQ